MADQKSKMIGSVITLAAGVFGIVLALTSFGGSNSGSVVGWLITSVGITIGGIFLIKFNSKK